MKIIRNPSAAPVTEAVSQRHPWKLLVVDDEPDVRAVTRLNLTGFHFAQRTLTLLEAGSAAEARRLLVEHPDIAVALIDVVMETDDAGLRLVDHIRKELKNDTVRIVIRTGQPGAAPERHVIDHYDIDDYKDKTELTATRLYTTVRSAIKAYRDIRAIDLNRAGLERILASAPDIYRLSNSSLRAFFQGVLTQIVGLCHLSDTSHIATTEGLIATFDHGVRTTYAATERIAGDSRLEEIHRECIGAIQDEVKPRKLRAHSLLIPLLHGPLTIGYVYIEPVAPLPEHDEHLILIMAQQCQSALDNLYLHIDLVQAYENVTDMLAEIAEFKDKTTGGHINRLRCYTRTIALELGLGEPQAEAFAKASRLHDVGKIGIDDGILRKPARLDPAEFAAMQQHCEIGARILGHEPALEMAREVALHHHERWDGTGYPQGLRGEAIPLVTRIVAVADVFDALMSHRPYKEPWAVDDALREIAAGAGSQFDPAVVAAFLSAFRRGEFAALVRESVSGPAAGPMGRFITADAGEPGQAPQALAVTGD